jgi:hypothetical protein
MSELQNMIEYYKDLLLYQYINQPKARATIGLLCSQALVDLLPKELYSVFDLDTATGSQLDILGEYIGLDRMIESIIPRDYFTLDDYESPLTSETAFGFTSYTAPSQNVSCSMYLYVFYSTANNRLEDSEYRILLKLKAALNSSSNSLYDINAILSGFFGESIYCSDQFDMSLVYFTTKENARIMTIARNENLLPRPMGVEISGLISVENIGDIWGFTSYTTDSGKTMGFSSYSGWKDSYLLDYQDRVA